MDVKFVIFSDSLIIVFDIGIDLIVILKKVFVDDFVVYKVVEKVL